MRTQNLASASGYANETLRKHQHLPVAPRQVLHRGATVDGRSVVVVAADPGQGGNALVQVLSNLGQADWAAGDWLHVWTVAPELLYYLESFERMDVVGGESYDIVQLSRCLAMFIDAVRVGVDINDLAYEHATITEKWFAAGLLSETDEEDVYILSQAALDRLRFGWVLSCPRRVLQPGLPVESSWAAAAASAEVSAADVSPTLLPSPSMFHRLYSLCYDSGWKCIKKSSRALQGLAFCPGGSRVLYTTGQSVDCEYLRVLEEASSIFAGGVLAISHGGDPEYYRQLLRGEQPLPLQAPAEGRPSRRQFTPLMLESEAWCSGEVLPSPVPKPKPSPSPGPAHSQGRKRKRSGLSTGPGEGVCAVLAEAVAVHAAEGDEPQQDIYEGEEQEEENEAILDESVASEIREDVGMIDDLAASPQRDPRPQCPAQADDAGGDAAAAPQQPQLAAAAEAEALSAADSADGDNVSSEDSQPEKKWLVGRRVGPFRFTPKQAGKAGGENGGFEAACPFHRKNEKSGCRKFLLVPGPTVEDRRVTARRLLAWCTAAPLYQHQWQHLGHDVRNLIPPPLDVLRAHRVFREPAPPRSEVTPDGQSQIGGKGAAEEICSPHPGAARAERGGRGGRRGRGGGRAGGSGRGRGGGAGAVVAAAAAEEVAAEVASRGGRASDSISSKSGGRGPGSGGGCTGSRSGSSGSGRSNGSRSSSSSNSNSSSNSSSSGGNGGSGSSSSSSSSSSSTSGPLAAAADAEPAAQQTAAD